MNIQEQVLKELYVETYDKLISSPAYKHIKLNCKGKIEWETIHKKLQSMNGIDFMKSLSIGLEKFIEDYGDTVEHQVKEIDKEKQEYIRQKGSDETTKLEPLKHEYIYTHVYLQSRLNIIETELKNFNQKPVIDKDGFIVFVEIKQP